MNKTSELPKNAEKASLHSELLDAAECGVFAYTVPDCRVIDANSKARDILGIPEGKECSYSDILFFIDNSLLPESREDFRCAAEVLMKSGVDSTSVTFKALSGDNVISVNTKIRLKTLADGTQCLVYTMLDVTDQFSVIDRLRRDRISFREAFTRDCEYSFSFDLTTGIVPESIVTAHRIDLFKVLGIDSPASFDEMIEKYISLFKIEFLVPEDRELFTQKALLEAYESGKSNVSTEYFSTKMNIYIRVTFTMYYESTSGHVLSFVTATDVTDFRNKLKAHTEALEEACRQMNKDNDLMNIKVDVLLESLSGGLRIIDADNGHKYIYVSEGAAMLQGYTPEAFVEKFRSASDNAYEPDIENALAEINSQAKSGGVYDVKYRVMDLNGSLKWVSDRGKLITDENGKRLYYSVLQDVSEFEGRNARLNEVLSMQQQMADSIGIGIFGYTLPERKVLVLNREVREMFGFTGNNPDIFGRRIMDFIVPEDRNSVLGAVKSLKNPGDQTEYVCRARRMDGTRILIKNLTRLLSFDDGQRYILSAMMPAAEKGSNENVINTAKSFISDGECFMSVDISSGVCTLPIITKKGEAAMKALGYKPEMSYNDFMKLCLDESRIVLVSGDIAAVKTCEALGKSYESGRKRIDIEYHVPSTRMHYVLTVIISRLGDTGKVIGGIVFHDQTAEQAKSDYLRITRQSLRSIYSSIYYVSLSDREYISVKHPADIAEKLPERGSFDEFVRVFLSEYVEEEFRSSVKAFLDTKTLPKRLANKEVIYLDYKRIGMGWCRAYVSAAERDSKGRIKAAVFAGCFIEEQKEAELAAQDKLRHDYEAAANESAMKSDFISNLSHDIRTPMNAIVGMIALAETHIDDKERVADCLSKINISSKNLLAIINDIIDMSQLEAGKFELHNEFFNLPELIDSFLTDARLQTVQRKQKLSVSVKEMEHENVVGDFKRLHQLLTNLMNNAIKYTPDKGKISFAVSEKPCRKSGMGCYEFVFTDTGIGMSEDFIPHIFEPFARATDDVRVENIPGSGLGLVLANDIVRMMDGNIKVESKINKGTKFTVTVYFKVENDSISVYDDRFKGLRVLIADNDEAICRSTAEMLSDLGIICECVTDGGAAVERVIERHSVGDDFFAVILDRKIAGTGGIKAVEEIMRHSKGSEPVMIFSAYDCSDIEDEAREAGVSAFISKPIFRSRIIHLLGELSGDRGVKKQKNLEGFKSEDFSSKRALLVEDNELNAEIAGEILSLAGLKVEYAVNGKEAVDIIANTVDDYYDIIFMDIQMPVMNGYDAARAIRALPGGYAKHVPIIAMTANTLAEDITAAKNAGMNEHISKPIDFDRLLMAVKKWLDTN